MTLSLTFSLLRAACISTAVFVEDGRVVSHALVHCCKFGIAVIQLQAGAIVKLICSLQTFAGSANRTLHMQISWHACGIDVAYWSLKWHVQFVQACEAQCSLIADEDLACSSGNYLVFWLEVPDIAREGSNKLLSARAIPQLLDARACQCFLNLLLQILRPLSILRRLTSVLDIQLLLDLLTDSQKMHVQHLLPARLFRPHESAVECQKSPPGLPLHCPVMLLQQEDMFLNLPCSPSISQS